MIFYIRFNFFDNLFQSKKIKLSCFKECFYFFFSIRSYSSTLELTIKMNVESVADDFIPNDQPKAETFKLKIDHFGKLFDWLSLEDLNMLAKTCKHMQRIVGIYFEPNYAAIVPEMYKGGISRIDRYSYKFGHVILDDLSSYLKNLVFFELENIQHNKIMKADHFKSLTEILLTRVQLTDRGISFIKDILGQLKTVKLKFPYFQDKNNE